MPISAIAKGLVLPVPVLVVEDDPLVAKRLAAIMLQMGYRKKGLIFAATLAEARKYIIKRKIGFALVDLGLPDGSGIDLIAELRRNDSEVGILVVSAWSTHDTVFSALRLGATGYIIKERDDVEVALALRSALRGGAPIDPFIAGRIIAELNPNSADTNKDDRVQALSPREFQILRLVAQGLGNREIAEELKLSRYTVETHIKHIYRKLAVSSRTKAVSTARHKGYLE